MEVDMGPPILAPAKIPTALGGGEGPVLDAALEVDGERLLVSAVSLGNPHAVVEVADPARAPVGARRRQKGSILKRRAAPVGARMDLAE